MRGTVASKAATARAEASDGVAELLDRVRWLRSTKEGASGGSESYGSLRLR
jgi:hypothetical protein